MSGSRVRSRERDSSGEMIEKYGFSVVAAISVTQRFSTAGSRESCWALVKRWISSRKRTVSLPKPPVARRAPSMTARTSLTPAVIAESSTKRLLVALLTTYARVVLPVPGGPQRITDEGPAGPAAALADEAAQRRARLEQMLLADDLVQRARTHPDSEGAAGRVLLLAVFGCCGKEVGLHAREAYVTPLTRPRRRGQLVQKSHQRVRISMPMIPIQQHRRHPVELGEGVPQPGGGGQDAVL